MTESNLHQASPAQPGSGRFARSTGIASPDLGESEDRRRGVEETTSPGLIPKTLSAGRVAVHLSAIILALVAMGIFAQFARWRYGVDPDHRIIKLVDLEGEKNLPALFSGLQLLLAAAVAWLVKQFETQGRIARDWAILAVGMLTMAFDEVFGFHERLIEPMQRMLGGGNLGALTYAWVVPAMGMVVLIAVYFVRFLAALPRFVASLMILSGAVFLGGAIGFEMLGGWYWANYGYSPTQSAIVIAEEILEYVGVCLFIYAALRYQAMIAMPVRLTFDR